MLVECTRCNSRVDAKLIKDYDVLDDKGKVVYSFLQCPGCTGPFLTVHEEDVFGPTVRETLYPTPERPLDPSIPMPLQSALTEARRCLGSGAFTAAAIMCRKTLEGICAEHGLKGAKLVNGLRKLRDKGVIDARLFEWAEALRIAGNAHDVRIEVTKQDATDLLEFTHALLEYLFTFRERFEAFKKRRSAPGVA